MFHSFKLWGFLISLILMMFVYDDIKLHRNLQVYDVALESVDIKKLANSQNVTVSNVAFSNLIVTNAKKSGRIVSILRPAISPTQSELELLENRKPNTSIVVKFEIPVEVSANEKEEINKWLGTQSADGIVKGRFYGNLEKEDRAIFEADGLTFAPDTYVITAEGHAAPFLSQKVDYGLLLMFALFVGYGILGFLRSISGHYDLRTEELHESLSSDEDSMGAVQKSVYRFKKLSCWKLAIEDAVGEHFAAINLLRIRNGLIRDLVFWPRTIMQLMKTEPEENEDSLQIQHRLGWAALWLPAVFCFLIIAVQPFVEPDTANGLAGTVGMVIFIAEWILLARWTPLTSRRAFYTCFLVMGFGYVIAISMIPEYIASHGLGATVPFSKLSFYAHPELKKFPWLPVHMLFTFWMIGYLTWAVYQFFTAGFVLTVAGGRKVVLRDE